MHNSDNGYLDELEIVEQNQPDPIDTLGAVGGAIWQFGIVFEQLEPIDQVWR